MDHTIETRRQSSWEMWAAIGVLVLTILGVTVPFQLIVKDDIKESRAAISAIREDMRDFHGRMERQDAEFRGIMAAQDAEFRGIMAKQDAEFKMHMMYLHDNRDK